MPCEGLIKIVMPDQESDAILLRMQVIAQIWADYLPRSFIEPHYFLIASGRFGSINLVNTLWDNGKPIDNLTFHLDRMRADERLKPPLLFRIKRKFFKARRSFQFNRFCLDQIRKNKASLLHFHFGTTAADALSTLERAQLPAVVTFYGVDASAMLRDPIYREKYKKMSKMLSRMIVLCEAVRLRLIEIGCDPAKITVWNLPADIEKYRYQERAPAAEVRFIIGARFVEKKGHIYLLEAFHKLIQAGRKAKLTMIGYGGLRTTMEIKISDLGLAHLVRIIDTEGTPDFAAVFNEELKTHDIFVLPSTTAANGDDEGGPALTLVAAQAAGLPVICTPFPGADISVRDMESGLLCRENDPESLAERMAYLADHPELWNTFGRCGHEIVRSEFSEAGQMEKLFKIYEECLRD